MHLIKIVTGAAVTIGALLVMAALIRTPPPLPPPRLAQTSCGVFASVEQLPDNRVTFKLCAPSVDHVQVVEDSGTAGPMTKDSQGIFTGTTIRPLKPDYYRYYFLVDGVRTVDPLANNFGENLEGVSGIFEVTGPELNFTSFHKNLQHGPTAELFYWSKTIDAKRRIHIYTPPGYPRDSSFYPVLYLLHGGGDNDDAWGTIGRANAILDNLIASGEARKMIIVMPDGNMPFRGRTSAAIRQGPNDEADDFDQDFLNDIITLVESYYRTINDPDHRAIAGRSLVTVMAWTSPGMTAQSVFAIRSAAIRCSAARSSLLVEASGKSSTNQTKRGCA